jgi:aminotransferase
MERQHLDEIAVVLRETNIMVLSDEIYAELTYGARHVSIAAIPGMYERTVLVNGFSKSHALTGWRMGYVCAPPEITVQMLKIHQYAIMSAPTTSQYAAIEAMINGDEDTQIMRREYNRRRLLLLDGLRKLGLPCFEPRGAFYMFPYIGGFGLSSSDFCEQFLLRENVAIIPGTAFGLGGDGFARLCYASSLENIEESLRRLGRFIDTLK